MIPKLRRVRALILHRTSIREKDRIVDAFSREEGRLRLLAAGVRRFPSRRAGHLEPLMESEIVVSASPRGDSIRDSRVLRAFPRVREHLDRLRVAYYVLRLLREGTPERLPDARLYDALLALLRALDRPEAKPTPLFALSADLQLLRHFGVLPDTSACARCRQRLRAGAFSFDARTSGFLCRECVPSLAPTPHLTSAVKLLRVLARNPVPSPRLRVPSEAVSTLTVLIHALLQPVSVQVGLSLSERALLPE